MKNKVIIFGILDTAELAYYYLKNDSLYEVVGFCVNEEYLNIESFKSLPVVAFERITEIFPPEQFLLFVPMTGVKMNNVRKNIYLEGKSKGYEFISYVSSKATVLSDNIGENCFILEDNTIQPYVKIGNNVVLWSGNHIGHHSTIEDHVFFTSHIVLSGHCHVKERAWIGVNTTIKDHLTIGKGSLIGMGALVTKNTHDGGYYIGYPARKQTRLAKDIY